MGRPGAGCGARAAAGVRAAGRAPGAGLAATISGQVDVACFGEATGTATVSVTGGTPGYTYSRNTTPTQTTATARRWRAAPAPRGRTCGFPTWRAERTRAGAARSGSGRPPRAAAAAPARR